MKSKPNAKINLGLQVLRRRADGYHDLATIFVPVPLCDELVIEPAARFAFVQDGIAIGGSAEDNLVVKAYRVLQRRYPQVGPVAIRLTKRIPFGAGLGGGSADAAFCLRMLNDIFALSLTPSALASLAATLGADCAFFVRNEAAYATGVGDILQPIEIDLSPYQLLLLKSDDVVSTREAYAGVQPNDRNRVDLRVAVQRPIADWPCLIENDFEPSVLRAHPRIAALKRRLYEAGALFAAMTGSGAAVYGLFPAGPRPEVAGVERAEVVGWYGDLFADK